jgi:hypothetical protein
MPRNAKWKNIVRFSLVAALILFVLWLRPDAVDVSVRPNYGGWVYPRKDGMTKKEVYFLLRDLGARYGLTSRGSGSENDNYSEWQIGVFCKQNLTAHFFVLGKEGHLSFGFFAYGFNKISDYESFRDESILILKKYGAINQITQSPILSDAVMKEKESNWKGEDLTSKCEGKT